MAKLKTSFTMSSSTTSSSDALSTNISVELSVAAPLIQQGSLTTSASGDVLINGAVAPYDTVDTYVYLRADSTNGTNKISLFDDGGSGAAKFGRLEAGDWMWVPVHAAFGLQIAASGGTPKVEYAIFQRA
tara:strand:- start:553 stop:942 length:390 start_codon:yes stop_codon:yes gene_type:complete